METAPTPAEATPQSRTEQGFILGGLFGGHALTHLYHQGYVVLLPRLYRDLGLMPLEAGVVDGVRWLAMGLTSILIGFFSDMFYHRRRLFLGLSLVIMGAGYFLVSRATSYLWVLPPLALGAIGVAGWHPPALGFLAQRFPRQRGLYMSLHRSLGNLGDVVGPVLVGILLLTFTWRQVLQMGFPMALFLALLIWAVLRQVSGPRAQLPFRGSLNTQLRSLRQAFRGRGMTTVLGISAVQGMAFRATLLALPLYLAQQLKMGPVGIGFHIALLTLLGMGTGPVMGAVSDRVGRKPVLLVAMLLSSVFALLIVAAGQGPKLTLAVAGLGIFLFSEGSVIQAAAVDMAEGMRLESTLVGLLFGNSALFGALSPVIAGALAGAFAQGGQPRWEMTFYYTAALFLAGVLLAWRLPAAAGQRRR